MSFGDGYDASQQTAYLDSMLRWGMDWLIKTNPDADTLYVLVGTTDVDDVYWGGDQSIPQPRKSYKITRENPGTEAFASCAAAFAATSFLYNGGSLANNMSATSGSPASLKNTTYSAQLLGHAKTLWNLASTTKQQYYQKVVPQLKNVYASSDYLDDLTWGATWMAVATGDPSYLTTAQNYYTQGGYPARNGALNWDQKAPALPVLLAQVAQSNPSFGLDASKWRADAESWLDPLVGGTMYQSYSTKGSDGQPGLFWFDGDSDSASLNPALNAAMLILQYEGLASSTTKANSYRSFADGQIDYALGKNPMNVGALERASERASQLTSCPSPALTSDLPPCQTVSLHRRRASKQSSKPALGTRVRRQQCRHDQH